MNKITPQQRDDINRCHSCDYNGLVEIMPSDKAHHPTVARCPHNAGRIVEIKRLVEIHRASEAAEAASRSKPRQGNWGVHDDEAEK